jgi:hypothetical protein
MQQRASAILLYCIALYYVITCNNYTPRVNSATMIPYYSKFKEILLVSVGKGKLPSSKDI